MPALEVVGMMKWHVSSPTPLMRATGQEETPKREYYHVGIASWFCYEPKPNGGYLATHYLVQWRSWGVPIRG